MAHPAHRRRSWLLWYAIALGLAAVIVVVWGLGGFDRRNDLLRPTPPGTLITAGPYQFTFVGVLAQRKKDFDDQIHWQLTAVGTGRTTGDISIAPKYDDTGTFVSKDVRSGEVRVPTGVRYGDATSFTEGSRFTPGLPPVSISVDFDYPDSYVPQDTLVIVVFQLEFTDTSLLGSQDPVWHKTDHGFDYRLPVKVLPDATS